MFLRKWLIRFGVVVALLIVAGVVVVLKSQRKVAKNVQRLPDGSTVELKQVMLTSTNFTYTHRSRGAVIDSIALVVPDFLLTRFPVRNSGSFGLGATGGTNPFVITQHRRPFWARTLHKSANEEEKPAKKLSLADEAHRQTLRTSAEPR